jgi:cellulose biosynthesis protein BcsQ
MIKEIRTYLDIKAYAVLNQVIANTNVSKEAHEALEGLTENNDIKLLNAILYHRTDYKASISTGKGVIEYKPYSKAADEIKALYNEIKAILEV